MSKEQTIEKRRQFNKAYELLGTDYSHKNINKVLNENNFYLLSPISLINYCSRKRMGQKS